MQVTPLIIAAAALWTVVLCSPATAQQSDAQAMEAKFQNHKALGEKSRNIAAPKTEKHRGLVLIPSSSGKPAQTQEITFDAVPEEDQVNIHIRFDFNSRDLRADQLPKLDPVCAAMTSMATTRFRIIGHTDASGTESYNDTLSVDRAGSVYSHLRNTCGIAAERLQTVGVGERYLADPQNPKAEANRRVEFQAIGDIQG